MTWPREPYFMDPQMPPRAPVSPEDEPERDPHEPGWIGYAVLIAVGAGAIVVGERFGVPAAFAAAVAGWTVVALATRVALRRWKLSKMLWRSVPSESIAPTVVTVWFTVPQGRPYPDTPFFVFLAAMFGCMMLTSALCLAIDRLLLARALDQSPDGSRLGA